MRVCASSSPLPPCRPASRRASVSLPPSGFPNRQLSFTPQAAVARLPLYFEKNQGQADSNANFIARGRNYTLSLTPGEAVFAWNKRSAMPASHIRASAKPEAQAARAAALASPSLLRLQLPGANLHSRPTGVESLPAVVNYLTGRDPRQWHTQVPTYGKVRYPGIYKGIDLLYYGGAQSLEYDFVVAPGADHRAIALNFKGAQGLRLDAQGDLVVRMADGEVRWRKPVTYQGAGAARRAIASKYVLRGKNLAGFAVASYDHSRPLVIDPSLAYSTYLGGSNSDVGNGIATCAAVDGHTYTYVTGTTVSTGPNPTNIVFVAKFELPPTGAASLKYISYLSGGGGDSGNAIAADSQGRAYVTGYTWPYQDPNTGQWVDNFPVYPTPSPMNGGMSPNTQWEDAFVAVLSSANGAPIFCKFLGGSRADVGNGIAVDSSYNIYVTGYTDSFPNLTNGYPGSGGSGGPGSGGSGGPGSGGSGGPGGGGGGSINHVAFPTSSSAFQPLLADTPYSDQNPNTDVFVTRYDYSGSTWARGYSTLIGGHGADQATSIAVDSAKQAYITGWSTSDYQGTPGAYHTSRTSGYCAFVAKLDLSQPGAGSLAYWTFIGGNETTVGKGIATDGSGCAYITGYDMGGYPTTPGAFQTLYCNGDTTGSQDAFVTKFNANGSGLVYSTYLGGSGGESGNGIAVDSGGNAYVAGATYSTNPAGYGHYPFPTTANALQTLSSSQDAFVTKFNPSGSGLIFSTYLGGSNEDSGNGIAIDALGAMYLTGSTSSSNFPVTSGSYYQGGSSDAFVTKINP